MKLVSKALLAAGLVALSACGGGAEENVAANNTGEDLYNVAPDDLTVDNALLGNETLGNATGLDDTTTTTDTNTTAGNTTDNTQ